MNWLEQQDIREQQRQMSMYGGYRGLTRTNGLPDHTTLEGANSARLTDLCYTYPQTEAYLDELKDELLLLL